MTVVSCFGLIRHAETEWNRQKKIQGRADSPLTAEGARQAATWGERLAAEPWDLCVTSPQGRAQATARLVCAGLGIEPVADARLREQDWGAWEGMSLARIEAQQGEALRREVGRGWDFRPPGGESRREVLARARAALMDLARGHPGRRILIVTHQGVIKCLFYELHGRSFLPGESPLFPKAPVLHRLQWPVFAGPPRYEGMVPL